MRRLFSLQFKFLTSVSICNLNSNLQLSKLETRNPNSNPNRWWRWWRYGMTHVIIIVISHPHRPQLEFPNWNSQSKYYTQSSSPIETSPPQHTSELPPISLKLPKVEIPLVIRPHEWREGFSNLNCPKSPQISESDFIWFWNSEMRTPHRIRFWIPPLPWPPQSPPPPPPPPKLCVP